MNGKQTLNLGAEDEPSVVGLNVDFCADDPWFRHLKAQKLKLATHTKSELEEAILDASKVGWQVAVRCHCSETGRHGAKLFKLASKERAAPARKSASPRAPRSVAKS